MDEGSMTTYWWRGKVVVMVCWMQALWKDKMWLVPITQGWMKVLMVWVVYSTLLSLLFVEYCDETALPTEEEWPFSINLWSTPHCLLPPTFEPPPLLGLQMQAVIEVKKCKLVTQAVNAVVSFHKAVLRSQSCNNKIISFCLPESFCWWDLSGDLPRIGCP